MRLDKCAQGDWGWGGGTTLKSLSLVLSSIPASRQVCSRRLGPYSKCGIRIFFSVSAGFPLFQGCIKFYRIQGCMIYMYLSRQLYNCPQNLGRLIPLFQSFPLSFFSLFPLYYNIFLFILFFFLFEY